MKTTVVTPPRPVFTAHRQLEQTLYKLNALLEMSVKLHHYATLDNGFPLTDSSVAGLTTLQNELQAEANAQLTGSFSELHQLTRRN